MGYTEEPPDGDAARRHCGDDNNDEHVLVLVVVLLNKHYCLDMEAKPSAIAQKYWGEGILQTKPHGLH